MGNGFLHLHCSPLKKAVLPGAAESTEQRQDNRFEDRWNMLQYAVTGAELPRIENVFSAGSVKIGCEDIVLAPLSLVSGRMRAISVLIAVLSATLAVADEIAIDCGDQELVVSHPDSTITSYSCFRGSVETRTILVKDNKLMVYDSQYNDAGEQDGPFEMYSADGSLYLRGQYRNGEKVGEWLEFSPITGKAEKVVYPE